MGSEGKKAVPGEDVEVLGQNLEERSGPHLAHLPSASPNLPGLPSLVPAAAQASGSVVRRRRSTVVGADSSGHTLFHSSFSPVLLALLLFFLRYSWFLSEFFFPLFMVDRRCLDPDAEVGLTPSPFSPSPKKCHTSWASKQI
jgi:hypothetical protein